MQPTNVNNLRHFSRKLIRELGMLELNKDNITDTPPHWHCLIEISQNPHITISKLSQLLVMHISSVSRLVNSLCAKGLVKFENQKDQREKHLILTKKGENEIRKIDEFSNSKILNAFRYLGVKDQEEIIAAIKKYSLALEKSRLKNEIKKIKILTLTSSKALKTQVKKMIENIQINEFSIPITAEANACILNPEDDFIYNNSCNFWYAIDENGAVIGSIALKKIDRNKGEIKKFFVVKEYRGQNVSQALLLKLLQAAKKHGFSTLFLGTVDVLKAAQSFYLKYNFHKIAKKDLPKNYETSSVDTLFFKGLTHEIFSKINSAL